VLLRPARRTIEVTAVGAPRRGTAKRRARVAALVFVAFVAAAGCHGTSQKSNGPSTPTWNAFCDVATAIGRTNRRPGLFADRTTILHRLQRQLARLAAATPSAAIRADLREAEPFLFRAYEPDRVALTSRRLAAVAAVDTALYDHCSLGRVIFDLPEATSFPTAGNR
jgi:hypothetical protein